LIDEKTNKAHLQEQEDPLAMLKDLLLKDELEQQKQMMQDLGTVKSVTLDEEGFEKKLQPFFQENLDFLQENFFDLFGDKVSTSIKMQIKQSRPEIVEALYPILGSMVRRYIAGEFKRLNERIDRTVNKVFTRAFWKNRAKSFITGVDHADIMLDSLYESQIEDVLIIEKKTGLLIGKYNIEETGTDQDVIAGALTAIKGFAESALGKQSVELEQIDYGEYTIMLHNFYRYYFAVICSGTVGHYFKLEVNDKIMDFSQQHLTGLPEQIDDSYFEKISIELQKSF